MVCDRIGASKHHSSTLLYYLALSIAIRQTSSSQTISLKLIKKTTMKFSTVLLSAAGVYRVSATVSDANMTLPFTIHHALMACC